MKRAKLRDLEAKVVVDSRWCDTRPAALRVGTARGKVVRVRAIVDGYVVARRYGCYPFLLSLQEFVEAFVEWTPADGDREG